MKMIDIGALSWSSCLAENYLIIFSKLINLVNMMQEKLLSPLQMPLVIVMLKALRIEILNLKICSFHLKIFPQLPSKQQISVLQDCLMSQHFVVRHAELQVTLLQKFSNKSHTNFLVIIGVSVLLPLFCFQERLHSTKKIILPYLKPLKTAITILKLKLGIMSQMKPKISYPKFQLQIQIHA